ncbi:SGNH hydrolase [Tothia fuscella]|uniref:SGNH hydrolase n=1 Tax=Tothia fuscella TaxID=1048955 RepID=A0A9P4U069_9PEZI|nr:SGNH hydrolase [Tothia fuscella]
MRLLLNFALLATLSCSNALVIPTQQHSVSLPKDLKLRNLPLGDSITQGMGHSKGDSYRKDLYDKLTAFGAKVEYVGSQKGGTFPQNSHEGWIGFTIEQISQRADDPKALGAKPNLVLLLAGTNDMTKNDPKGASAKLQKLVEKIVKKDAGVVVILGTLPPITATYMPNGKSDSALIISEFNRALPGMARALTEKGAKVLVADLSAVKLGDLKDLIHPDDAGYSKMAAGWFRAIEDVAAKGWLKGS